MAHRTLNVERSLTILAACALVSVALAGCSASADDDGSGSAVSGEASDSMEAAWDA